MIPPDTTRFPASSCDHGAVCEPRDFETRHGRAGSPTSRIRRGSSLVGVGLFVLTIPSCMWHWERAPKAKRYHKVPVSEVDGGSRPRYDGSYEKIGMLVRNGKNKNYERAQALAAKHGGHVMCFIGDKRVDVMVPETWSQTVGDTTYTSTSQTASGFKRTESRYEVYRWVGEGERPRVAPPTAP